MLCFVLGSFFNLFTSSELPVDADALTLFLCLPVRPEGASERQDVSDRAGAGGLLRSLAAGGDSLAALSSHLSLLIEQRMNRHRMVESAVAE